ncbi:MAG: hypothetical protein A4E72_01010 [Syntrophus sp. PtaU1.Bin208]|nr:MAG: hypothetical protein A4E72_01010 [Syntrophus sp. PtaU1.Bin208]
MFKNISLFAIHSGLVRWLYYLIRFYFLFCRVRVTNETPLLQRLSRHQPLIVSIWHQRILTVVPYSPRFAPYSPSVMISRSRDGELVAQLFSCMKFRPIRGSSSRGGKGALSSLIQDLQGHAAAIHVVDGPRGPRGIIKPGLITLSQLSGAPIFPISASASRAWILNSWDRCLVPKPFSTIHISWDDPIFIPPDLDPENFERRRLEVQNRMLLLQQEQDARLGWENLFE